MVKSVWKKIILTKVSNFQAMKNMFSELVQTVVQTSKTGWLDAAIEKAVVDLDNVDKIFSSVMLKDAVQEIQDERKTSEVI